MRNIRFLFYALLISLLFTSCFEEDEYVNTKRGNFEALWRIMDEHYCFFEYKDVDWQEVHDRYSYKITEDMTNDALFEVLGDMLGELKDGHVNLTANHDKARYWKWYEDYPDNFYEHIQREYIGTDYALAGGMKYKIFENNIGYIYYGDFSLGMGEGNLDQILFRMSFCKGLIIDIRHNGGGMLSNAEKFARRFFSEKTLVGYIMHKTGKGHNDFSKPYERSISPTDRVAYLGNVVLLTNRRSYSATNDFVSIMSNLPKVTVIGDNTGGGSGLPFSSELPNGWSVRLSMSPLLNAEKEHTEFGLEPDIKVDISTDDFAKNKDTILDTAIEYLLDN